MANSTNGSVPIKGIEKRIVTVRIVGTSPLIQHAWNEKNKDAMRQKHAGRKTRDRDVRDTEQEGIDAGYYFDKEKKIPGILAVSIKAAVIEAAHQDLGIAKTLVRKSLFVHPVGRDVVVPMETRSGKGKPPVKIILAGPNGPVERSIHPVEGEIIEDIVRLKGSAADLRYRPYYFDWACVTQWEIAVDMLRIEDFLTLLDRAGYGVGIHEWRPEKGGEYGRFAVDTNFEVKEEVLA